MNYLTSPLQISAKGFYIPVKEDLPLNENRLYEWYANLLKEVSLAKYSNDVLALMNDKHNYYGKYFDPKSRRFFLNHFARNLSVGINFLINTSNLNLRTLEIGSGCGNQLLLMAFLGAEVVGCDIRHDVFDLVQKRKEFYEKISGRKLNISLICNDVFKVDWERWGKFDAVNFLFSFNNLQPNEKILGLVNGLLKPGGRVVFQEMNLMNYYNRIIRPRNSMTPQQVVEILIKYNFKIRSLQGGCALPPISWRFLPRGILLPIDQILCRSLFMSPSYHLMAEKI